MYINLSNPLIMRIAGEWYGNYSDAVWPSPIAFITYTDNPSKAYVKVVTIHIHPANV